jgi:LemA family
VKVLASGRSQRLREGSRCPPGGSARSSIGIRRVENTENEISTARRNYITAVRDYNLSLRTFPTVLWAKTAFSGNKPMAEFAASEGSEKPPVVKF